MVRSKPSPSSKRRAPIEAEIFDDGLAIGGDDELAIGGDDSLAIGDVADVAVEADADLAIGMDAAAPSPEAPLDGLGDAVLAIGADDDLAIGDDAAMSFGADDPEPVDAELAIGEVAETLEPAADAFQIEHTPAAAADLIADDGDPLMGSVSVPSEDSPSESVAPEDSWRRADRDPNEDTLSGQVPASADLSDTFESLAAADDLGDALAGAERGAESHATDSALGAQTPVAGSPAPLVAETGTGELLADPDPHDVSTSRSGEPPRGRSR